MHNYVMHVQKLLQFNEESSGFVQDFAHTHRFKSDQLTPNSHPEALTKKTIKL